MRNTALLGTRLVLGSYLAAGAAGTLVAAGLLTKMLTAKPAAAAPVASQPEPAAGPLPGKAPQ